MRVISRLDIKNNYVIKGLAYEGLKKLGKAEDFSRQYYEDGIDEIIYIDNVASLYSREGIFELLKKSVEEIFVPITVGGGIRSVEDAYQYFLNGADKVFLNTAAVNNPDLINELAAEFGSANITLSVETIIDEGSKDWSIYTSYGRDKSLYNLKDWIIESTERGIGEIFLSSINFDGFQNGFDLNLVDYVLSFSKVPVVLSSGFGKLEHLNNLPKTLSGIAIGSSFHYKHLDIGKVKQKLLELDYKIRNE